MADVLLLYASTHGHTAKIAARIAEGLRAEGVEEIDVRDAAADTGALDPGAYDAVILGGSLHAGHHQEELVDWIKSHHAALAGRPSAFFSVSLTAADDTEEAREATQRCIDEFLAETGWSPTRSVAIAGALVLTLVSSAIATFGVVTAVGAIGADEDRTVHKGGPVTDRVEVAKGSSTEIGPLKILSSEAALGDECLAVEFLEPERHGGVAGMRAEMCGHADPTMALSTLNGEKETLIYGRVPASTARVTLTRLGSPRANLAVSNGPPKVPGRFVIGVVPGTLRAATAVATDSSGEVLGSRQVATPGD